MRINQGKKQIRITVKELRAMFLFAMLDENARNRNYEEGEIARQIGFFDGGDIETAMQVVAGRQSASGYLLFLVNVPKKGGKHGF